MKIIVMLKFTQLLRPNSGVTLYLWGFYPQVLLCKITCTRITSRVKMLMCVLLVKDLFCGIMLMVTLELQVK